MESNTEYNLEEFEFLYDHILVEAVETKVSDGLVNPEQADARAEFGRIVRVGEGRLLDNGTVTPTKLQVGDIILFSQWQAEKLRSGGKTFLSIREDDVRAVYRA
jgi:chaperonin GroES